GQGQLEDIARLEELGSQVKKNSLCGLGQTAPNPVLTTIRHFRSEYEAHVKDKRCPAAACRGLISFTILPDKCICCGRCAKNCPVHCISGQIGKAPARATDEDRKNGKVGKYFEIQTALCIKCGACFDACPTDAVVKK
ncbi:MAG: NADH-ubiquinone oxidoreductase-F iron-sulfur binding region domain-containing protein, partial [Kiritimatiellota bacterium]|nr:NADH-ubiquinone oxidoreductase-F iron-sulfur binding region domain-containing protein [Kiritimatiellota bacterium]